MKSSFAGTGPILTFDDTLANVDAGVSTVNVGLNQCYLIRALSPAGEDTSNTTVLSLPQLAILALTSPTGPYGPGTSVTLNWTLTSQAALASDNFTVEYSTDGTTWSAIGTVAAANGPLTNQAFSKVWTTPSLNSTAVRVRVTYTNGSGASVSAQSSTFLVDSTGPTISSFSLAGGSTTTANPSVAVSIAGSDALTSVSQMQFSESSTPGTNWVPYATSAVFTLSQTNGSKTVYAWLKDSVGNVSAASTYAISLDLGSPPVASVTSPVANSSYLTGASVPVAWSCSSSNALDASPVRLSYTTDDGTSYTTIGGWITNNATATTGTYNWTLPVGVTVFRILVECKSAAGVVASALSPPVNTSGWSIFAGDPSAMSQNISATLALMINGGSYWQSLATDAQGNIFFAKGSVIMKVDYLSGLVTQFAGSSGTGCTMAAGSDPSTTGTNQISGNPVILGTNLGQDSLFLWACSKIWKFNTSTRALSIYNTNTPGNVWYLSRVGNLFYSSGNKLYKLDMTSAGQTPVVVHGNGTCSATGGAVSSAADLSPIQGAITSNNCAEMYFFTNTDDSKVWVGCWEGFTGCSGAWRLDWNFGTGKYVIGANNLAWSFQDWDIGWCSPSSTYNRVWCNSRWATGKRVTFNLNSETWEARPALPANQFIHYGASPAGMVSLSSTNILNSYIENSDGTINTIQIGGSNIEAYGNGTDLSKVAFSTVDDISYAVGSGDMIIRTAGGTRRIAMPSYPTVSIGTYTWNGAGSSWNRVTLSRDGTKAVFPSNWCGILGWNPFSVAGSTLNNLAAFFNVLGCAAGSRIAHPVADSTAIAGNNFGWENLFGQNNRALMHSNGKQYFFVTNANSNAVLYSSDRTTLHWIAGKSGAAGYNAADAGNSASTAQLTYVSWIGEIPAGSPQAGDLLILDGTRLRMITITTQVANPLIKDLLDLSALAGYPAGATITDFLYDNASELNNGTNNVVGSGAMYFVTSANAVYKVAPTAVAGNSVTAATLSSYSFTGTSFSGTARIALTPAGLLVTQPNKNRILRVAP